MTQLDKVQFPTVSATLAPAPHSDTAQFPRSLSGAGALSFFPLRSSGFASIFQRRQILHATIYRRRRHCDPSVPSQLRRRGPQ